MQPSRQEDAGRKFVALHQEPRGFIMPNAWDCGSAAVLAAAGFPALGTTSAGIAFSLGRQDYGSAEPRLTVSREEMFDRARAILEVVDLPVSADLEAGYGDSPEAVAETIGLAIDAGLAGANIEDKIPGQAAVYEEGLAVDRIAAARAVIDSKGAAFVLTARTDLLQLPQGGLPATIRRLQRFREAGAHCLFAPGSSARPVALEVLRECRAPLNFVAGLSPDDAAPAELLAMGAQRVSLGGSLARSALGLVRRAADELLASGTLAFARRQVPQSELNALFTRRHG